MNRKRKLWVCLLGIVAVVIAASAAWLVAQRQSHRAGQAQTREQLAAQQELVAAWFADCQAYIDRLDRAWQVYERVNAQFLGDQISIETTYVRLQNLHEQSEELAAQLPALNPPLELAGDNYDLAAVCYHRIADYAGALHKTLELAAAAADKTRPLSWEEQARRLRSIRVMHTPPALFIAEPLARLRDNVNPELHR